MRLPQGWRSLQLTYDELCRYEIPNGNTGDDSGASCLSGITALALMKHSRADLFLQCFHGAFEIFNNSF